jgi:hypothetical protein
MSFAVFRGSYIPYITSEWVHSAMIFDITLSADGDFFTATFRGWRGYIVEDNEHCENDIRNIKIHSPLRMNQYGRPFSPKYEKYVVLPYFVRQVQPGNTAIKIPVWQFDNMNWMPRTEQIPTTILHPIDSTPQSIHAIRGTIYMARHFISIGAVDNAHDSVYEWMKHRNLTGLISDVQPDVNPHLSGLAWWNSMCAKWSFHRQFQEQRRIQEAAEVPYYDATYDDASTEEGEATEVLRPQAPYFVYANHFAAEAVRGSECPITMEPLASIKDAIVSVTCGHIFQKAAFETWQKTCNTCPSCRSLVTEILHIENKQPV